ncbi:fungal-specific transcription factor domain-containing protein [Dactylonectria estremocensis]|uniref:Fungal-specific transcription factor domain-containing protein n=1 Tax=Dactylonectria estremocensis TaxID=1079267 RepID=A0A9P9EDM3_9HYPO|nr:fungal-specific transcription factor domain-containing protein [Dactylonectria estremocensis]
MNTKTHPRPFPPRRPPIFRVKTGCFTCRERKKKCDEIKPLCAGCKRNKLDCRWPTSAQRTRKAHVLRKPSPERDAVARAPAPHASSFNIDDNTNDDDNSNEDSAGFEPPIEREEAQDTSNMLVPVQDTTIASPREWETVPKTISPFPCQDGHSVDLLSHYLSRTALSMGNGSIDINPFISQLVPLSFANGLILDLILCQSAVHRAIQDTTKVDVAHRYYNKSLRLFRKSIQDFVDGQETNPLWIVVGALIMCFTETAKGDSRGIVFNHIKGAGPLLSTLLNHPDPIGCNLKSFIIEYYIYTASISLISMDPAFGSTPFLSPELERQGQLLLEMGYVGQLCGGWLELLLLLPQIFRFGQRLRQSGAEPVYPTADDFIVFSRLQMHILSFQPSTLLGSDVALCGDIFKQAIHLYLLTALTGSQDADGPLKLTMGNAIDQAFESLRQLSSTSRINTSLCWALGVIGSCVADEAKRNELRARLEIMFLMIGLGNIQETCTLLEHVWALPASEQSPWVIWRVMRDKQVWISFA